VTAALVLGAAATACTPSIGDKCVLSTDCSLRGERLCDSAQPDGYCTIFDCRGNLCPDEAACVLFHPNVAGCSYDDRTPSRSGRTFCLAQCHGNSDCRPGYVCADPRQAPWSARILDDDQTQRVCIVPPDKASVEAGVVDDAPVCSVNGVDASAIDAAPSDAAPRDGGADAPGDAAPGDASGDAADAGIRDASDAG